MIQPKLRVGLLQADLIWNNVSANLSAFEAQLDNVEGEIDLFILPEMFSTGFCMEPETVDSTAGEVSLAWLLTQAKLRNAGFCGSLIFRKLDGKFVNRMFIVDKDGTYTHYDKWHRFALGGEDKAYATGSSQPVIAEFRGWKILLQVCYDLRFPVYSRNKLNGYDAVVYVANWPKRRKYAWRTLLAARAIENQAYCIGVNRTGTDDNGLVYEGDSLVIDPLGNLLLDMQEATGFGEAELSHDAVVLLRKKLPFLADADSFSLHD